MADEFDIDFEEWIDEDECQEEEKKDVEEEKAKNQKQEVNFGYEQLGEAPEGSAKASELLTIEMDKVTAQAASTMADFTQGQRQIALRKCNWDISTLESDIKTAGGVEAFAKETGISSLTKASQNLRDSDSTTKCVDYIQISTSDYKANKKILKSSLYKIVSSRLARGESQASIIGFCRKKKYKAPDILKALQVAQSNTIGGFVVETSSKCDSRRGKTDARTGAPLHCGHWRCKEHWDLFLTSQVGEGVGSLQTRCNFLICHRAHVHTWKDGCFCGERVPKEIFERFVGANKVKMRFKEIVTKNFADYSKNSGVVLCPGSSCNRWWKRTHKAESDEICCPCGTDLCSKCGLSAHDPLPCANAMDFKARGQEDAQTRIWRELNTATCPNEKCGVVIERYITNEDHCLHMICSQCKYHWCWACRQRFKVGGGDANHTSYYKCTYLQSGSVGEEVKKREQILRESQMFKFYKARMDECEDDIKQLKLLKNQLINTLASSEEVHEYDFLFQAIDKLITATKRKRILNPVAFYSAHDSKKKLFEFQLKYMEEHYDKLFDALLAKAPHQPSPIPGTQGADPKAKNVAKKALLEKLAQLTKLKQTKLKQKIHVEPKPVMRSLEHYKKSRDDIKEATQSVTDFFGKLFKMVREGKLVTILESPDPNNKGWYCSKCQRNNEFGKSVCECAWTTVKP